MGEKSSGHRSLAVASSVVHNVGKPNTGKRWWRHVPLGSGWKWVVKACG
ncbi:hypothetical protein ERO13_A10G208040v2 [Gossypium hirsutum]|nr:hypothetical protein ERO13_A10G208040v2 [Gossypium hirsutum]